MNINLNLKDIKNQFAGLAAKAKGSINFILVMSVLLSFVFIVIRVNLHAQIEPTESELNQKLQNLQQSKIDEEAIKRIQELESTNVDVKTLFKEARDNPFQE